MTERIYYADSHLFSFRAAVAACEAAGERWRITLDRTAFFPEGGGQPADTGRLGEARVLDVREENGEVIHLTDRALPVGETTEGEVDAEQRLRRMQNHSGEHVVSGLVHRFYGYDNVGFHMGAKCMTIDFSGELSREMLLRVEEAANAVVRDNRPVRAWFPGAEELAALDYRSKKELTGEVRLVEIKGVDLCACCAPHVSFTGEIGAVKILSAERHRGGMRVELVCGMDAMEDYAHRLENGAAVSRALSVPQEQIAGGVERLLAERDAWKARCAALSMELVRQRAALTEGTEGNLVVFDSLLDEIALRELVNLLAEKCGGFAAAFSGSDGEGYRYIIGSRHVDLRALTKRINAAVDGRGGGSAEMIQGRASADEASIKKALLEIV